MADGAHLTRLDTIFYRMKFAARGQEIFEQAQSPEGRFHHDGQPALYLSETPEGTAVASKRYIEKGDGRRAIFPLRVVSDRIADLRDEVVAAQLGIETQYRAAEWQSWRARGEPAPTWEISDRARELGLHGILYASRTQPALSHLTLFCWNQPGGATVSRAGPPVSWPEPQTI